jgi:hypothetical protein
MRATPVDFLTILALPECLEPVPDFRVNLPPDHGLVDHMNPAVAIHATCAAQRPWAQAQDRTDIQAFKYGIDGNPFTTS